MILINFKLVTIICEPGLKNSVLEMSQELGATGFTITDVRGQGNGDKSSGEVSDLKLKIEIVLEPGAATRFMHCLAESYFENYPLITYASDILVLRHGKFEVEKS